MIVRYQSVRTGFRIGLFLSIGAAIYFQVPIAGVCYISIGYLRLICPVGFLEVTLAGKQIYWHLLPAFLLVMLLLFLIGRAFCAWVCPSSLLAQEGKRFWLWVMPKKIISFIESIGNTIQKKGPRLEFSDGAALTVGAFIGITIFGYPFISTICPIGVITRNFIELLTHFRLRFDLFLLIIPFLAGLFFRHGWKMCCPVGTLRGWMAARNRTLVPTVHLENCKQCGMCLNECPSGVGPHIDRLDLKRCIKCLHCMETCPQKAIGLSLYDTRKGRKISN
jgi:ferredoxin-type protein NapH